MATAVITNELISRNGHSSIPSETVATVQPPQLAFANRILDSFSSAVQRRGLVGERATALLMYLVVTSRLLSKPVSIGVKGHSSAGKSYIVQTVCSFFPREAVIEMTAMSQRALVYSPEQYAHRTLVLYELVALREGVEDDITSYFVRSLLSEGRIEYPVTVRDKNGGFTTRTIVKEGPTGLVFTTTQPRIHAENETRVLSVTVDDSPEQTTAIIKAIAAADDDGSHDSEEWFTLQRWLQTAEHDAVIPYAAEIAQHVPPVAVRLRRDFSALLSLIKSHAILHQMSRERDTRGRVVATLDDYAVVSELVAPLISEGVGATASPATRDTVGAVAELAGENGVTALAVAGKLKLDKSTVTRRLAVAASAGWVRNQETRHGQPGRWVIGESLPDEQRVLPTADGLREAIAKSGCTVARDSEGIEGEGWTT